MNLKSKLFVCLISSTLLFCLSDAFAGYFRGETFTGARAIIWVANITYNLSMILIALSWMLYAMMLLKGRFYKTIFIPVAVITVALIIFNVTNPLHHLIFTINSNNLYSRGPMVWINFLYALPCYFLGCAFLYHSESERRQKIAVILYPVFPILATILQFCFYGITTGQIGITAAIILIYFLINGMEVDAQRLKAELSDELSKTDTLTGLKNRRSYVEKLDELASSPWVGVAFIDLNGLKAINDEQGHSAGDAYITSFAVILKDTFPLCNVYRISGDEFVVLCTDQNTFKNKADKLYENYRKLASIGCAFGHGKELKELIVTAETNMYKNKAEYYKSEGIDRRKY